MLSAAILAGGRALRLGGQDKSALDVGGLSILERLLIAVSPLARDILIVGREPGDIELPGPYRPSARVVPDRVRDAGPLGGIDTAFAHAQGTALLVVACDMPFVTTSLLAHFVAVAGAADAVVPCTDRGYHPLCALYARTCARPISGRVAAGRGSVRSVLNDLRVRTVGADELEAFGDPGRLLANVNTPEEYASLVGRNQNHTR
jgi:molybdopterin-guanine dinucleotide biosynthesis protein A